MLDDINLLSESYIPTILDFKSATYYYKVCMYFFENRKEMHIFNCRSLRECYVIVINGQHAAVGVCEEDIWLADVKDNDERVCCVYVSMTSDIYKFKIYKTQNKPIKPNRKIRLSKDYESMIYITKVKGSNPDYRLNINDKVFETNKHDYKQYYNDITKFCVLNSVKN